MVNLSSPRAGACVVGAAVAGFALAAHGGGTLFFSGMEPPCTLDYIGGGGSGEPQNCVWHTSTGAAPGYSQPVIADNRPRMGKTSW